MNRRRDCISPSSADGKKARAVETKSAAVGGAVVTDTVIKTEVTIARGKARTMTKWRANIFKREYETLSFSRIECVAQAIAE